MKSYYASFLVSGASSILAMMVEYLFIPRNEKVL